VKKKDDSMTNIHKRGCLCSMECIRRENYMRRYIGSEEKQLVIGYLPMDCPICKRRRLEYAQNDYGAIINVTCEKCENDFTNFRSEYTTPETTQG
jgi:hypothetical protein